MTADAPLLLAGGRFPTGGPEVDAVLIRQGVIAGLGRHADLRAELPPDGVVHDLAGATVLPGLGDAHVHFTATGYLETAIDCSEVATLPALLDRVAARARAAAPGELVLGLRLEHLDFPSRRIPTLDELTAAAPHNPVYLRHITGHASVANGPAFELLDFDPGQAGVVLGAGGRPTGYMVAQATQLATQHMYSLYAGQIGYENAFRAAAAKAAREGCTTVHALDDLDAIRTLVTVADELPVRVVSYPQTFDLQAVRALGLPRIGGCHGSALDGDFDMGTAATLEPYANRPGHFGVLYHDDLSLEGFVAAAHQLGLQVCFHAVGDRAVEQALTAFAKAQETYPRPDPRHRIEHAQLITEEQMRRAAALGVVISLQPSFNHKWNHTVYPEYVGGRAARIDPLRSLLAAGVQLAGGSDSTVTDLRPLLGLHAAVNHSRSEERITVAEALRLFTEGVAFSSFDERHRGRLEPGFDADLTVIDQDPFAIAPERLRELTTLMTVVRGRIVFRA